MTSSALLHRIDVAHTTLATIRRATTFTTREANGGTGTVYDTADRMRRDLNRLELAAVQQVLDVWDGYRTRLLDQLEAIEGKLAGIPDDLATIERLLAAQARTIAHLDQVQSVITGYTDRVDTILFDTMDQAARQAAADSAALASMQLGGAAQGVGIGFNRLPADAVTQLVAQMHAGPVAALFTELAGDLAGEWRTVMAQGIAAGLSPRDVAGQMSRLVDVPRWRTLNIARTETLRAYRETTRQSLATNRTVMAGWRWSSALDQRTCPMCWAMHGTLHSVDEVMATHVNCRCAMAPATRSMADLGLPDVPDGPNLQVEPGVDVFARQTEQVQRAVLGPAKYQAWSDGLINLEDLVGERFDPRWGAVRFERPLSDVLQ